MKYNGFISYSHAADGELAPALQRALSRFAKPWYRMRALRIFRDQTSLSATPELWPSIERALSESEFFVLLASPVAAASPWVGREIDYWLEHRSVQTLLLVLTEGEIVWSTQTGDFAPERSTAIPPALSGAFAGEPRWVDMRWARERNELTTKHPEFANSVVDLAAALHRRPKDELVGEDVQQHRRTRRVAGAAIATLVALTVTAIVAATLAVRQSRIAEQRRLEAERRTRIASAQRLAALADGALEATPQRSLLLAVEAVSIALERGEETVPTAELALRAALGRTGGWGLGGAGNPVLDAVVSDDGRWLATGGQTRVDLWDLHEAPGAAPVFGAAIEDQVSGLAVTDSSWLVATTRQGQALAWDLRGERPVAHPPRPDELEGRRTWARVTDDRRWLVITAENGPAALYDLRRPEPLAPPRMFATGAFTDVEALVMGMVGVTATADGRWLAARHAGGPIQLWDMAAESPEPRTLAGPQESWSSDLAISPDERWLAAPGEDNVVRLWDLTAAEPATEPAILSGHEKEVLLLAFSPDGRRLATGGEDRTARVWDLEDPQRGADPLVLGGHGEWVDKLSFGPNGRWLLTGSMLNWLDINRSPDQFALLWDLELADPAAAPRELAGHEGGVGAATITPDGRFAVTGGADARVRLWPLEADGSGGEPVLLDGHSAGIRELSVTADSRNLVSRAVDGGARVWDLEAPQPSADPLLLPGAGGRLHFGPDGRWLVTASRTPGMLWDLSDPRPATSAVELPEATSYKTSLPVATFSDDRRWLLATGEYRPGALYDLAAPEPETTRRSLGTLGGPTNRVVLSTDSRWAATLRGYRRKEAALWRLAPGDGPLQPVVLNHDAEVTCVGIGPAGRRLVTADAGGAVLLWDLTAAVSPGWEPSPIAVQGHSDRVRACLFTPDARRLITGGRDGRVQLVELGAGLEPGAPQALIEERGAHVTSLDPAGRWLLIGGENGPRLWDLETPGGDVRQLRLPEDGRSLRQVRFTSDGRWLAAIDGIPRGRLWRLPPAVDDEPFELGEYPKGIGGLEISPGGRWAATHGRRAGSSRDPTVRLWDLATDPPVELVLRGHEGRVGSARFSGDSRWLITTARDPELSTRVWDLEATEIAASSRALATAGGVSIQTSPDGRWLATAGDEVRLFRLRLEDLIAAAATTAGRNLSRAEWELYFPGEPYRKTFPSLPAAQPPRE